MAAEYAVLLLQSIILLSFLEELDVRELLVPEHLLHLAVEQTNL